jgi:hypothetical protein
MAQVSISLSTFGVDEILTDPFPLQVPVELFAIYGHNYYSYGTNYYNLRFRNLRTTTQKRCTKSTRKNLTRVGLIYRVDFLNIL